MRVGKVLSYDAGCDVMGVDDGKPVKPGIAPILFIALIIWASCASAYALVFNIGKSTIITCLVISFVFSIASLLLFVFGKIKKISLCFLSVCLGICFASIGAIGSNLDNPVPEGKDWQLYLLEDAAKSNFGSQAIVKMSNEEGIELKGRASFKEEVFLKRGDTVKVNAFLKSPKEQDREYFWFQGLTASISVSEFEQVHSSDLMAFIFSARNKAIDTLGSFDEEKSGIIQALACGYRNSIKETGVYEEYKIAGLAHIIAVSGAHLSIVSMMLGWLLERLRASRSVRLLIISAFILSYLIFTGVPISAVRAAIMVILSLSSFIAHRRSASLNALAISLILFIATDPVSAVSVSLFLSAGSTLGIILFSSLISSWFSPLPKIVKDYAVEPLSLTISSNIMTQPFSVALFSQLSLVAPLSNILVTPFFSLACVASLMAAITTCIAPAISVYVFQIACFCVLPMSACVSVLASIPYASISVNAPMIPMILLSLIACASLWIAWPSLSVRACSVVAGVLCVIISFMLLIVPRFHGDEIIMLNVGQGDAFLIRSKGAAVLIDTGNKDSQLRENLAKFAVYKLDAVVISHHDDDHCASLDSLAGYTNIKEIYTSSCALACTCKSCKDLVSNANKITGEMKGLDVGDVISVGNFNLEVIWPREYADEGENSDSLCILASVDCNSDGVDDWSAVFLGDAESRETEQMVESGYLGDIDILKVGHHGSKVTLNDELVQTLKPEIALISVGKNNRYGHPSKEAIEDLQSVGSSIFRTDESGNVVLSLSKDGIQISQKE